MEGAKGHRGEIVVVDNNSDDRTAEIAKARGVRVVFEPHNQISKARNRGASQSKGENLFFVDADTIVSPSLFLEALSLMKRGACGGGGRCCPSTARTEAGFGGASFLLCGTGCPEFSGLPPEAFFFAVVIFSSSAEGFRKRFTRGKKSFFQGSSRKCAKGSPASSLS